MQRALPILLLVCPLLLATAPTRCGPPGLVPADGASLNYTHVRFEWEPVCGATGYDLEVIDAAGATVASQRIEGLRHWTTVTEGLDWDTGYSWTVRPTGPDVMDAAEPHRFSTRPLPENLLASTVSEPVTGELAPGITCLDPRQIVGSVAQVCVDRAGEVVWFYPHPLAVGLDDKRQLPNGNFLGVLTREHPIEFTVDGETVREYLRPEGEEVHHEAFPMPNGNILAVANDTRSVLLGGETVSIKGDQLIEIDRETNEVVWRWSAHDHYSYLDPPQLNPANWVHFNAVIYDPVFRRVYVSSRSLSRITAIDYDTGEIVFNMGKPMPSGDVDFDPGFRLQHAPQILPNGNMLLHDNGQFASGTRALELAFDDPEQPTSASIAWQWYAPSYSQIIGDADLLPNGNVLFTSGARFTLFPSEARIYEVSPAGDELWRYALPTAFMIYRAERVPSLHTTSPGKGLAAMLSALRFQLECRYSEGDE
jgi:hypothetical protein